MTSDKLKNQTSKQPIDEINKKSNSNNYNDTNTIVNKVRRQIRFDLFSTTFIFLITFTLFFFIPDFFTEIIKTIYIYLLVFFLFSAYYGYKIFKFYENSYKSKYDSKESILSFYYELKILIENLKSFLFIVYFSTFYTGYLCGTDIYDFFYNNPNLYLPEYSFDDYIIFFTIIIFFISLISIHFFTKISYGRSLNQLKNILNNL